MLNENDNNTKMPILIVQDINLHSDDESTNGNYKPIDYEDEPFEESLEEEDDKPMESKACK